jgi:transposase-like protein
MWLPAERLSVSRAQRRQLTHLVRDPLTPKRVAARALIVLGASGGTSNSQLAQELSISRPTVIHWRRRFEKAGVAGLLAETPRETARAAPARAMPERAMPDRAMSDRAMPDRAMASRRQPSAKLLDIIGIYVYPPDQAVAFSVETLLVEQSGGQPVGQPAGQPAGQSGGQPQAGALAQRAPASKTRDYIRHGAATLFAALAILTEKAAGDAGQAQQHLWLLEFLETIDRHTPAGLQIHLIAGAGGSHQDPRLQAWFAGHARFHVHCTPPGGSWINLTRRWWFAEIKREQIRQRALGRVAELVRAVDGHILGDHGNPRPFVWTAALSRTAPEL